MQRNIYFILFLLLFNFCYSQDIVINEIMTKNSNTIVDDFGKYSDWVEIYNNSTQSVNINQWYLSDNEEELNKWQFPDTTIQPNGFLVVFCSDQDTLAAYLHTNFKLDSDGDHIILSDENENIVDHFTPVNLDIDISYGRKTDGNTEIIYFYTSSPGFSNNNNLELNKLSFSHDAGFYDTNLQLAIFPQYTSGQIFYTRNGNEPVPGTSWTYEYLGPLSLNELQNNPAEYSFIPTTPEVNPQGYFSWEMPNGEVEKHVVIRARLFTNNQPCSNTYTNSYFLGTDINTRFTLPVLSLIADSTSLFDYDTGIYVPGKYFIDGVLKSGNYNQRGDAWERKSTFEYFSETGELLHEQDLGMRIHGNISRAAPQKGLQFYPRNQYDGKENINYPFFENRPFSKYKRVLSRSIYSAQMGSIVRDVMVQEMAKNLNVDYQDWQPNITFINGEYWGLQIFREKQNEYYLEQHFGIDPDSVDIIELWGEVVHGDGVEHWYFLNFTENNDLSTPENYEIVKEIIDIPSYIDYNITEIFFFNKDWPGNNYKKWRKKGEGNKWRWFLYDLDATMKVLHHNSIRRAAGDTLEQINPEWSTKLFKAIIQNDEFSEQFISRFVYLLNNDFSPEVTIPIVDKWESIIEYEVENTIMRWGILDDISEWRENMNDIRYFLEQRPCLFKTYLEDYFNVENLAIPCDNSIPYYLDNTIKVFPNPVKNVLTISSIKRMHSWELYDFVGRPVLPLKESNHFSEQIDLSHLSQGVYTLIISDDKHQYKKKIIKIN